MPQFVLVVVLDLRSERFGGPLACCGTGCRLAPRLTDALRSPRVSRPHTVVCQACIYKEVRHGTRISLTKRVVCWACSVAESPSPGFGQSVGSSLIRPKSWRLRLHAPLGHPCTGTPRRTKPVVSRARMWARLRPRPSVDHGSARAVPACRTWSRQYNRGFGPCAGPGRHGFGFPFPRASPISTLTPNAAGLG